MLINVFSVEFERSIYFFTGLSLFNFFPLVVFLGYGIKKNIIKFDNKTNVA